MKDFERYLKEQGVENASNLPEDALQSLIEEKNMLTEMFRFSTQTGISPVVFGFTDCRTGTRKEYYITETLLLELMKIMILKDVEEGVIYG